jgi:hypothetical protein
MGKWEVDQFKMIVFFISEITEWIVIKFIKSYWVKLILVRVGIKQIFSKIIYHTKD